MFRADELGVSMKLAKALRHLFQIGPLGQCHTISKCCYIFQKMHYKQTTVDQFIILNLANIQSFKNIHCKPMEI